jgi:hypothetical protein
LSFSLRHGAASIRECRRIPRSRRRRRGRRRAGRGTGTGIGSKNASAGRPRWLARNAREDCPAARFRAQGKVLPRGAGGRAAGGA